MINVVVRFDPFTCTVEPDTNPLPLTVSVKAPLLAVTLAGDRLVIMGPELALTVKASPFDVPAAVVTVIVYWPKAADDAI